jgi:hypothetical protein
MLLLVWSYVERALLPAVPLTFRRPKNELSSEEGQEKAGQAA